MKNTLVVENFVDAGESSTKMFWDEDIELQNLIDCMECVVIYLELRGDCGIVIPKLRIELNSYEDMMKARKRDKI